jgi:hypothetical protein
VYRWYRPMIQHVYTKSFKGLIFDTYKSYSVLESEILDSCGFVLLFRARVRLK